MDIPTARQAIDELDTQLVGLLSLRMELSLQVARLKAAQGLPPRDSEREQAIIQAAKKRARLPLTPEAAARVFEALLEASRDTTASQLGKQ